MSQPLPSEQIAQQYRFEQLALRAALLYEVARLWDTFNEEAPERAGTWIDLMVELITGMSRSAISAAVTYYDTYRTAKIGRPMAWDHLDFDAELDELRRSVFTEDEQVRRSMAFLGPVSTRHRIEDQGWTADRARDTALVEVSGAATRLTLEPAREIIPSIAELDDYAIRFARVTAERPCYFCAAMASRGPIYLSRETAGARNRTSVRNRTQDRAFVGEGAYKFHDHCQCTVVPVFSRDEPWPGKAREYQQLWKDSTKGAANQMNAFRKAYDAQYPREA